jgi:hypothetical protein
MIGTKRQITKAFFPAIQDKLKMKTKDLQIVTTMTTGNGNLISTLILNN